MNVFQSLFHRLWHSPTLTTWAGFVSKSFNFIIVLPLVLTHLSIAEIALWYLFNIFIGLQPFVDVGFGLTFSRVIAYAMGGATKDDFEKIKNKIAIKSDGKPNRDALEQICSTMHVIYNVLTLIAFLLLVIFGTWSLTKPVEAVENPMAVWASWGVILFSSTIHFYGNKYVAYLQGINHIALLQRWQTFFSLLSIISSTIVLLIGGGILGLAIANQSWRLINVLTNRWLCSQVGQDKSAFFRSGKIHSYIFDNVWPSAWRSGIGVFLSYGLVQISGVIYAQIGTVSGVASYLLALRLIHVVAQFCQAPFYSKLPVLARLYSENKLAQQISIARRGMTISYWTYIIGFIGLGIAATPLLTFIESNVEFVDPLLWSLLGIAFFVHRYGGMHIQLYSTTNHIIWHIANGVSGIIFILVSLGLFNLVGVYAFPFAYLCSNVGFYAWYAVKHSYQAFGLKFWQFESKVMLPSLVVLILFIIGSIIFDIVGFS